MVPQPPARFGQLLVQDQVLTATQRDYLLTQQTTNPRPIGELAQRLLGISREATERAWSHQYLAWNPPQPLAPWLPPQPAVLSWLSPRRAWQFELMPLYQDEARLYLAISPHRLPRAITIAWRLGSPIELVVVDRNALLAALERHYPSRPAAARQAHASPGSWPEATPAPQPEASRPTRRRLGQIRADLSRDQRAEPETHP